MAKRGRKANKGKPISQASAGTEDTVLQAIDADKVPIVNEKPYGTDQITKYFPASPKTQTSQLTEDVPGLLTPETTPTKNITKKSSSSETSPATSSSPFDKCTPSESNKTSKTEKSKKQTVETDSPEHKRISPNVIATSEEMKSTNIVCKDGSGDSDKTSEKTKTKPNKEHPATKAKPPKSGKSRKSRTASKQPSTQTKTLKDYFPVRRSNRRCKSDIEEEQKKAIEEAVLTIQEDGIKVTDILGKGRGVVSTKPFIHGDFVVEYYGDLISIKAAQQRESDYAKDPSIGCYMYYFQFKNKQYCIDATMESGRLGRLLNHSSKSGNCCTKLVEVKGQPHLIIVAARDISEGEELLYDYGDRNKESMRAHPWLAL